LTERDQPNRKSGLNLLAFLALLIFLATSFRAGWTRSETDFPNYYTAAWLIRRGAPLRNYYDWTWFQRQMNYAGVECQLGGYIPQTPLTMVPMIGLASFPPQTAKRIWLTFNIGFLAATVYLLSRLTRFTVAQMSLLAFGGYGSLHVNFLLGQYYVFLLFVLTLAFYALERENEGAGGILFGAAFALKLYGGPFFLYLVVKRRWKAAAFMAVAVLALALLAIAIFGLRDVGYFAMQIFPRAVQGETLDPYHPGNGTLSTLLRRTLIIEPELNPQPLWNAPWLFFVLQPLATFSLLMFPLLALRQSKASKRDFALFFVAMLLASPNIASYTYILLLLPVALMLNEVRPADQAFLIACYILLCLPVPDSWIWLFPKVWLLLALFVFEGRTYWPRIGFKPAVAAAVLMTAIAALAAERRFLSYQKEPARRWERFASELGAIYTSRPVILQSGIVSESIGHGRYVLRWLHDRRIKVFSFDGQAIHPTAQSSSGPVQFELVAHRASTLMSFDPATERLTTKSRGSVDETEAPVPSPDGRWLAITSAAEPRQIWLHSSDGKRTVRLTGGECTSFAPAWELDSKALIFASDCGRGIGLPALYRVPLDRLIDK
jgi:hypothetical protein